MKKSMSRLVALVLALMLALSASAMATERASDPFRVPGARQRPQQATAKPTMKPEVVTPEGDSWTLGDLPIEPMPQPSEEPAPEQSTEPEVPAEPQAPTAPEQPVEPQAPVEPQIPAAPEQSTEPEVPVESEQPTEQEATPEPEVTPEPEQSVEPEAPAAPRLTVKLHDGRLNVHESAELDSDVIASLHNGDVVELISEQGKWYEIRMSNGVVGFVYSKYLTAGEPEPTAAPTPEPAAEPQQPEVPTVSYEYERNTDGSLKLDEDGNPVAILPEDAAEKPVAFQRDENGELILIDGKPIPTQFVPVEAQKMHTIEDVIDPNRKIEIYADFQGKVLYLGQELRMFAVLQSYDNLTYTLQWQHSQDNVNWEDLPGAVEASYSFIIDEDTYDDYWRVEVTVTGVIEED